MSDPGGCLLWGVSALGGVCSGGHVCLGNVSAPGGGVSALGQGVCSWEGCGIPACTEADTPPCEQNDKQVQKYYLGHNFVAAGNKRRLTR